ncbi:MAG: DNA alkylation repair protein [Muribaculaceae bacterium]
MTDNNPLTLLSWQQRLKAAARPEKIAILSSFFKCGKGEYGEGDLFLGINVPDNRAISAKYYALPLEHIAEMLHSPYHEFRLAALLALVRRYERLKAERAEIVDFYLQNTAHINNWDLVDLSCPKIIGDYVLREQCPELLERLSRSDEMWEQRIAIVSTLTLIRAGLFEPTITIAESLLNHPHDLIHKATGWMLREVGKRSEQHLIAFLQCHAANMPRTALRYAIERLDPDQRAHWLSIKKR